MLTALPCFEIEPEHDTESDFDREDLDRRPPKPRVVRLKPAREQVEVREPTQLPPPKRPISADEQLRAANLSSVRIREAVVKRMKPAKPAAPPVFRVPDLRIDWVRSGGGRTLKLSRLGADGFTIEGVATESSRVSVGIDGLIFSVPIASGELATTVLERLVRRLSPGYTVEVFEETPARASARLSSHT